MAIFIFSLLIQWYAVLLPIREKKLGTRNRIMEYCEWVITKNAFCGQANNILSWLYCQQKSLLNTSENAREHLAFSFFPGSPGLPLLARWNVLGQVFIFCLINVVIGRWVIMTTNMKVHHYRIGKLHQTWIRSWVNQLFYFTCFDFTSQAVLRETLTNSPLFSF